MSPFISVRAIQADELAGRIAAAKARRSALRVTVYTDAYLNAPQGLLHDYSQVGLAALARVGAEVKIATQLHNKTLCVDDQAPPEGSFNWLSASRREALARPEVLYLFRGSAWGDYITELVHDMESRVVGEIPTEVSPLY